MQATTTRILTHMDAAWSWADGRCNARAHSAHGGHPRMPIRAHRPGIMGVHTRPRSSAKWASTQHTCAPMIRLLWLHDIGRNGHPHKEPRGVTHLQHGRSQTRSGLPRLGVDGYPQILVDSHTKGFVDTHKT